MKESSHTTHAAKTKGTDSMINDAAATGTARSFTGLIHRHPLLSFFTLAYLGSWLAWSPWWLSSNGLGLFSYELPFRAIAGINQLGMFAGPFIAAFLVTHIIEGRDGVKRLWHTITQWRVKKLAYVLALLVIPAAIIGCYFLLPGGLSIGEAVSFSVVGTLASTFFIYLLGGPFQEEPGWRGFALPRLQNMFHPIVAALVLGVVHCFWHTPLFFTEEWDTARSDPGQLVAYLVLVVSLSVVLSWLVNAARGSVLVAILGHNTVNWALFVVATLTGEAVANNWPAAIGMTAIAALAIIVTHGRLGYKRD